MANGQTDSNSSIEARRVEWRQLGRGLPNAALVDLENGKVIARYMTVKPGHVVAQVREPHEESQHATEDDALRWCMERAV